MLGKKTFLFAAFFLILALVYAALNTDINDFSNSLYPIFATQYQDTAGNPTSFMISPLSIHIVYAMFFFGAGVGSNTQSQISDALITTPSFFNSPAYATQLTTLRNNLNVNARLFVVNKYDLFTSYRNSINSKFGAITQSVPFVSDSMTAANTINAWANANSQGKITNIIDQSDIDNNSIRCLAVSVMHINAEWVYAFANIPSDTFNSPAGPITISMLQRRAFYNYYDFSTTLQAQAVELQFNIPGISMVIFLPNPSTTLANVETNLVNVVNWSADVFTKLKSTELDLIIPKFETETIVKTSEFNFMSNLNVVDLFGSSPDLSRMFITQPILGFVSIHKSYINVKARNIVVSQAPPTDPPNVKRAVLPLKFDSPFVYVIKRNNPGTIISIGRYTGL